MQESLPNRNSCVTLPKTYTDCTLSRTSITGLDLLHKPFLVNAHTITPPYETEQLGVVHFERGIALRHSAVQWLVMSWAPPNYVSKGNIEPRLFINSRKRFNSNDNLESWCLFVSLRRAQRLFWGLFYNHRVYLLEATNPLQAATNPLQAATNPLQAATNLLQAATNLLQEVTNLPAVTKPHLGHSTHSTEIFHLPSGVTTSPTNSKWVLKRYKASTCTLLLLLHPWYTWYTTCSREQ